MIFEALLNILWSICEFFIRLLPTMPVQSTQFDAVFSGFFLLNRVIDVPFAVANALLVANLMVSAWFVKKVWDTGWNMWMAIKW